MKKTIISLSLIVILLTSSVSLAYGDLVEKNYKPTVVAPKFSEKTLAPKLTKHYTINLDERQTKLSTKAKTVRQNFSSNKPQVQPEVQFVQVQTHRDSDLFKSETLQQVTHQTNTNWLIHTTKQALVQVQHC